jgi:predicted Rossmann-fold nucleotide-binding protein
MRRVCVFCGASAGNDPRYAAAAADLGRVLAARTIEAVTGGGKVGLMGVVADATLGAGGRVIGVIPRFSRSARSRTVVSASSMWWSPSTNARR